MVAVRTPVSPRGLSIRRSNPPKPLTRTVVPASRRTVLPASARTCQTAGSVAADTAPPAARPPHGWPGGSLSSRSRVIWRERLLPLSRGFRPNHLRRGNDFSNNRGRPDQLRRCDRWVVLRLENETESPPAIRPSAAGMSQAGRTRSGRTTDTHTQSPNVRLDHAGSLSSTS